MLQISSVNRMKFERAILAGYNEYLNNSDYYEFLKNNDLLYYDDDAINSFKYRRYPASKEFRLILSKNFKRKYIEKINKDLLNRMASIINPKEFNESDTKLIIDDKISLVALIGFICFESISSTLSLDEFENKLSVLRYFAEQELSSNKNYLSLSLEDYKYLKEHPKLFCVDTTDEVQYKSKDEIAEIINNISETVNIPDFQYACSVYEHQIASFECKKM